MKFNILVTLFLCCCSVFAQDRQVFNFENGSVAYFVKGSDGLYGIEDSSGKIIIPKVYGRIKIRGNMIYCTNKKNGPNNSCELYNSQGKCIIAETDGYTDLDFIKSDEKWTASNSSSVFDENGDMIYKYKQFTDADGTFHLVNELADTTVIQGKYAGIRYLYNFPGFVLYNKEYQGVTFRNGEFVIPCNKYTYITPLTSFGETHLFWEVKNNNKYGLCDMQGKEIIAPKYDGIRILNVKDSLFLKIKNNDKCGLCDMQGKEIISPKYDDIWVLNDHDIFNNKDRLYLKVKINNKHGLCDMQGKEIIIPKYDDIQISSEKIVAKLGNMKGVIDNNENIIVPFEYTSIYPSEKTGHYKVRRFDKEGVCDKDGQIIVPVQYSSVLPAISSFFSKFSDVYEVSDGETRGLYSFDGKMIFPATLFKHVAVRSRDFKIKGQSLIPFELPSNIDHCVEAYDDLNEGSCYYDFDGNLLYDGRKEKEFDKYFDLGGNEFKKENYKRAIEYYKQALGVKQDGTAYYNIGAAYSNMGKYKDAIENLNSCLKLSNSKNVSDKASKLIAECKQSLQEKRERRAQFWLAFAGTALNVAATVAQTNTAINNYNANLRDAKTGSGNFKRDTSMDYLLDPRYAMMQVQQENWNEYLQMTNGGQTMTYEEWYANIKAPSVLATKQNETESSQSSTSSKSNSSSSTTTSNGNMCRKCAGTGDCKTCEGKGFFYNTFDISKKVLCPNCHEHNGKCTSCNGTGKI